MTPFNLEQYKSGTPALTRNKLKSTYVGTCKLCRDDGKLVNHAEDAYHTFSTTLEGKYSPGRQSPNDLMSMVDLYSEFCIDDKVVVWCSGGSKLKAHFAGVSSDGAPLTWQNGSTSWTARSRTTRWDNCVLEEEFESLSLV